MHGVASSAPTKCIKKHRNGCFANALKMMASVDGFSEHAVPPLTHLFSLSLSLSLSLSPPLSLTRKYYVCIHTHVHIQSDV